MSLSFSGWDVVYDDASIKELASSQTPKDKGVYTMYHGTSIACARAIIVHGFQQSPKGMLGPGVYVSRNMKKTERYPLKSLPTDRVVLQLRVHVGRVKRIDKDQHSMQYTWNQNGYDTAWVPPNCGMLAVPSGLEEDCVFDPKRIEVMGIAKAPSPAIDQELKQLKASTPHRPWNGSNTQPGNYGSVCALCNRKMPHGQAHPAQRCWSCDQSICPFMTKHVCSARQ